MQRALVILALVVVTVLLAWGTSRGQAKPASVAPSTAERDRSTTTSARAVDLAQVGEERERAPVVSDRAQPSVDRELESPDDRIRRGRDQVVASWFVGPDEVAERHIEVILSVTLDGDPADALARELTKRPGTRFYLDLERLDEEWVSPRPEVSGFSVGLLDPHERIGGLAPGRYRIEPRFSPLYEFTLDHLVASEPTRVDLDLTATSGRIELEYELRTRRRSRVFIEIPLDAVGTQGSLVVRQLAPDSDGPRSDREQRYQLDGDDIADGRIEIERELALGRHEVVALGSYRTEDGALTTLAGHLSIEGDPTVASTSLLRVFEGCLLRIGEPPLSGPLGELGHLGIGPRPGVIRAGVPASRATAYQLTLELVGSRPHLLVLVPGLEYRTDVLDALKFPVVSEADLEALDDDPQTIVAGPPGTIVELP